MEEIHDFISLLTQYFSNSRLIPFLGSGFTVNEKTNEDRVLSGGEFKKIMIDELVSFNPDLDRKQLEVDNFSDVADLFYNNIEEEKIDPILKKYFTDVTINDKDKLDFLSHSWKYLYTLNIDDGIERNSDYRKYLPNKEVKEKYLDAFKFVFKLHGDALEALTVKDDKSIIFSKGQYLNSLTSNAGLLSKIKTDYIQNNLIFIGCSLQDEIDLRYVIEKLKEDGSAKTNDLIYLTNKKPDANHMLKLETMGINKYILIADYSLFYRDINKAFSEIKINKDDLLSKYKNIKFKTIDNNFDSNLESLYRDYSYTATFNKEIDLPYYLINRQIERKIEDYIYNNKNVFYLIGKRCSGKTMIVFSILSRLANKDYYYFPTKMTLNSGILGNLLNIKNTIFIFDSNTLTTDQIRFIQDYDDTMLKNKSSVILIVNASDRIFASLMISYFGDNEIEISSWFTSSEINNFNVKISKCKISNFDKDRTILDNILKTEDTYGRITNHIDPVLATNMGQKELMTLILIMTYSKIYFSQLLLFGISIGEINQIMIRFSPFLEMEDVSLLENSEHSLTKLVPNSTVGLIAIINIYLRHNRKSLSRISDCIVDIVKVLIKEKSLDYTKLVMYDNLNQIFGYKYAGAKNLILEVYDKLEDTLSSDSHYWIQRAKAIYHMEYNNVTQLEEAQIYALKAYSDSDITSRVNAISKFTLANIYGRIARLKKYQEIGDVEKAIEFYTKCLIETIQYDAYTYDYIAEAKANRNRSDLYYLLTNYSIGKLRNYKTKSDFTSLYNLILTAT